MSAKLCGEPLSVGGRKICAADFDFVNGGGGLFFGFSPCVVGSLAAGSDGSSSRVGECRGDTFFRSRESSSEFSYSCGEGGTGGEVEEATEEEGEAIACC